MEFLHDGRPPVVREATYTPPAEPSSNRTAAGEQSPARRLHTTRLLQDPRLAQRVQQGMDHPAVRSRSAGGQRHQAAGRRRRTTAPATRRCCGPCSSSRRGLVDRLRHESALRRFRHLSHGRQRHRRSGAQLRGRRRRSAADRHSRQFLLGRLPSGPKRSARWCARRMACHDVAIALGTPFISGKDSLNNEFRFVDCRRHEQQIDRHSRRRC